MKLSAFHKKVRPLTNYLNIRNIPFEFKSSGSFHCLITPFMWPSTVFGWFVYPTTEFHAIADSCGLCLVEENSKLLVF